MKQVARLFYLSQPAPGVILLNLQVGDKLTRVEVTTDQVRNVIVDGAAMAFREAQYDRT